MSDRDSAHERLIKTLQQAPSREWIEQYLDLVKEVIEFAELENDDPRLVLSLKRRRNLPVTINGRYVLYGFRKYKPLVGFIFPHDYKICQNCQNVRFPQSSHHININPVLEKQQSKLPTSLLLKDYLKNY